MPPATLDRWKRAAAVAAVAEVEHGMVVGLGTGTTAAHAVEALAGRMRDGLVVTTVATSLGTAAAAQAAGLRVIDFADIAAIDLAIDGVDEIDPGFRAIKGGGGAMLREKIVAASAVRMIAVADATKDVARLGARPVPVEVLPFARSFVARRIADRGATATLRLDTDGKPWRSDQDNVVLDCAFGAIPDPPALAGELVAIPGLLGHGLFLSEIHALYLGTEDGVVRRERHQITLA